MYVVVVPLRRAKGAIKHLKSPDEMDLEEVGTQCQTAAEAYSFYKEK